jgi:hypothetical protein
MDFFSQQKASDLRCDKKVVREKGKHSNNDSVFLLPSSYNIQCPICVDVIEKACILSCGHEFCETCLTFALHSTPQCPVCHSTDITIQPDLSFQKRQHMNMMPTKCRFHEQGCEFVESKSLIQYHEQKCVFNPCVARSGLDKRHQVIPPSLSIDDNINTNNRNISNTTNNSTNKNHDFLPSRQCYGCSTTTCTTGFMGLCYDCTLMDDM